MNYSYITLLSSDSYIYCLIGLYESYKRTNSKYKFTCAITESVSEETRQIIRNIGIDYVVLDTKWLDELLRTSSAHNMISNWVSALSKLSILGLSQFDKLVYLDLDMEIMTNIDELFTKPHMSAVCDIFLDESVPYKLGDSTFNGGLFVFCPSDELFADIKKHIANLPKDIMWHDQNTLASYYPGWGKQKSLHLDTYYNIFINQNELTGYYKEKIKSFDVTRAKVRHYTQRKPLAKPFDTMRVYNADFLRCETEYFENINKAIRKYKDEKLIPEHFVELPEFNYYWIDYTPLNTKQLIAQVTREYDEYLSIEATKDEFDNIMLI